MFIFFTVTLKSARDILFFIFVTGTFSMSRAFFLKLSRALQNMSRAQKNQRAWWEFEKYGNFEKLSTGNFIFPKNVTGSFLKSRAVFRKLSRPLKKMSREKKHWILNCWIFHNIIDYLPRKKTKFRRYHNGNSVPVLSVSKTIRTRTLLRTTIWPLISSVPVPVLSFQKKSVPVIFTHHKIKIFPSSVPFTSPYLGTGA